MIAGTQVGRLVGSIALVSLCCAGCSTKTMPNASYWSDASGKVVRDGVGRCVQSINWTTDTAIADCDASLKKPAPAPVAAPVPAPAPAPVAAPAPAPVPVVVAPVPAPVVVAVPEPVVAPAPVAVVPSKQTIIEKPVRLEGANFATGSHKLLKEADSKLNEVVEAAKLYSDIHLDVTGYTDNVGHADKNIKLSQDRANSVKEYLVKNGVAAERINTKGLGAESPIADNKTADGRAQNRRVEIRYTIKEVKKN